MISQANTLVAMCDDQGLSSDRILIQLPATFSGIQAAQSLQKSSIDCEVIGVYSLPQAALAVESAVAVLVVNVCHVNLWYDRNPGAIRDPHVRSQTTPHVPQQLSSPSLLPGWFIRSTARSAVECVPLARLKHQAQSGTEEWCHPLDLCVTIDPSVRQSVR